MWVNPLDGSEMIYVPAGTFKMGGKEKHAGGMIHEVHVEAFYISKYEITNKQFKQFVDARPEWCKPTPVAMGFIFGWRTQTGGPKWKYRDGSYLRHWAGGSFPSNKPDPVTDVSWFAARAYCAWAGGRLPTEAEWEYATQVGSTASTHPLSATGPNAWGIHDLHGDVAEWTSSMYRDYPYKADDGREDPSDSSSCRVVRGGLSELRGPKGYRSPYRSDDEPRRCWSNRGFRLVVPAKTPN